MKCSGNRENLYLCEVMNTRYRIYPPEQLRATISPPPSKSIAARLMTIRALAGMPPIRIDNPCDDLRVLANGLTTADTTINVGHSGTALRLLTAFHATREGAERVITGSERLCQRPVSTLVDALRAIGAQIDYLDGEGHAPIRVRGRRLQRSARVCVDASVSSQYITALALIAPITGGMTIELTGNLVSRPYVEMTLALMNRYGIETMWNDNTIHIGAGPYLTGPDEVEADWSAAAFWLTLPLFYPDGEITLRGLTDNSLQGDRRAATLLRQWGLAAEWNADGTLTARRDTNACCCCSTFADLLGTPDLAPTLTVALCLLGRPFRLTGLSTLRHKESHRTRALAQELARLGFRLTLEGDDAMSWHFATCETEPDPTLNPHDDHRLAMALTLAALSHPGIAIAQPDAVTKSYPGFWTDLRRAGFRIECEK